MAPCLEIWRANSARGQARPFGAALGRRNTAGSTLRRSSLGRCGTIRGPQPGAVRSARRYGGGS
jgi:hypothetical protein